MSNGVADPTKWAEGGTKVPQAHPAFAQVEIVDREESRVQVFPPRKKLAVVGFSTSTRDQAPFDDPTWLIMGLNQLYRYLPRYDIWCEIHAREIFLRDQVPGTDYLAWLRDAPVPVMMMEPGPDIPQSMQFPMAAAIRLLGRDYFESSIAYMVAWGLLYGFEEIGIWGVDLVVGGEYCVSPDTRVLTADLRWIPAGKVAVGDSLVAFDEMPLARAGRRWREASVHRAVALRRPCYRVTLDDGTVLTSSAEHRWLVQTDVLRWRTTEQMARSVTHRNSNIRLVRLTDVWDEDHSWDAGYLAAAFDGEGSLGPRALGFAQRENGMSRTVEAALAGLGFRASILRGRGASSDCHTWSLRGGRPEIMRFLGQVRPRRLLAKFSPNVLGHMYATAHPRVLAVEPVGEQDVIGLGTSTGTFVAEGLASHNSYQRPNLEYVLGIAHAMGVKVTIPPDSAVLKSGLTRYGTPWPTFGPFSDTFFTNIMRKGNERREALITELNNTDGALSAYRNMLEALQVYQRGGVIRVPGLTS